MVIPSIEVASFLQAALECSVFVSPREPGLTFDEVVEVGKRVGYQQGEIGDAMRSVTTQYFGKPLMQPNWEHSHLDLFSWVDDPELRNLEAFDFVFEEFNRTVRSEGAAKAKLEREVIVERAAQRNINRHDVEVAISILLLTKQLTETNKLLWRTHGGIYEPLPSKQQKTTKMPRAQRARAFPHVKDVIERRSDGRPSKSEPLDAFAEALTVLGYGAFRLWWKQTVNELNRSDAATLSVAICVLSASLVEGALTFIVKHAQALQLGVFKSKTFEGEPRTWRIDELVASAARGGDSAVLDSKLEARAKSLIVSRQRIHAGRMLSDHPQGPPDLRPEAAREARETADAVVRAVLDWLEKYPGSGGS
jgi:hypothetical protein